MSSYKDHNTTLTNPGSTSGKLGTNATIDLGSFSAEYTLDPSLSINYPTVSITDPQVTFASTTHAGRMVLNGDNADLVINGVSILEMLKDRLNIMIPNPRLEKEWDELRELGDRYRQLEAKLKEQSEMWAILNKSS